MKITENSFNTPKLSTLGLKITKSLPQKIPHIKAFQYYTKELDPIPLKILLNF
jgi:hypothetical protein